ncbi:MAG: hypothetical protein ACM37U_15040 [Gemmatimonas sp.]
MAIQAVEMVRLLPSGVQRMLGGSPSLLAEASRIVMAASTPQDAAVRFMGTVRALGMLGDYGSAASTAGSARAAALNANSESGKAKAATTRADAAPHLTNAQQFIQSAINLLNKAENDYNSTDPASDPTGTSTGIAQGAIASAQSAINGAQANLNAAATYAQSLPASGGGGGTPPPPKTCPAGQQLDSSGNCVPIPTTAKKSPWVGALIGLAIGGAGLYAITQYDKKHRGATRAHHA